MLIGRKGFVTMLRALEERPRSFTDLRSLVTNPRTLSRRLREGVELGLVEKEAGAYRLTERGRRVAGHLARVDDILREALVRFENLDRIPHRSYVPLIERYCRLLAEKFGDRLRSIVIFGSVARGDWRRDSDIDLLVVVDDLGGNVWTRVKELWPVKRRLMETNEYKELRRAGFWPIIQNYPLSTDEARRTQRVYLDIVEDGIVLFDRDGFIRGVLQRVTSRLQDLGARRVRVPGRGGFWVLKEGARFGEEIEV